jgi:hypothetical protein
MMNKSLRGYGEESSGKDFYGFRVVALRADPRRKKRAAVSGGF